MERAGATTLMGNPKTLVGPELKVGDKAPDFTLPGSDGKTYTLADFKDSPVLMVIFLSNHCPVSHAAETRLLPFVASMKGRGVAVVAINPNSLEGLRIDELGYSKYSDGYEDMKLYARDRGFTFPYLYDGGTQAAANVRPMIPGAGIAGKKQPRAAVLHHESTPQRHVQIPQTPA